MNSLKVTSRVFNHGEVIPSEYTCDGGDKNPPLTIDGVPDDAKSLAIIMDDPDAPSGVWDHWLVFNIDPGVTEVEVGQEGVGTKGINSWEKTAYGGPCPPGGEEHRYVFKIYALDAMMDLEEGSDKKQLEDAMDGHTLARGEIVGKYKRQ